MSVFPRVDAPTLIDLEDALTEFVLSRQAAFRSPATVQFYSRTLSAFLRWLGDTPLTTGAVRLYFRELSESGRLNAGGLHAHARSLRAWTRFLLAEGIAEAIDVPMPRVGEPHRPCPTREDVQRLLRACRTPRDRALVLTLADTGVRLSECAGLSWPDVDFTIGALLVRRGKGGKVRAVYLGAAPRRALLRLRRVTSGKNTGSLFGLRPPGIREVLRRLSRRAGVHVTPHMLRRFYATESLRNGLDVLSLQRLLGHSTLSMTAIYVRMSTDDLAAAHARSSPGDRL